MNQIHYPHIKTPGGKWVSYPLHVKEIVPSQEIVRSSLVYVIRIWILRIFPPILWLDFGSVQDAWHLLSISLESLCNLFFFFFISFELHAAHSLLNSKVTFCHFLTGSGWSSAAWEKRHVSMYRYLIPNKSWGGEIIRSSCTQKYLNFEVSQITRKKEKDRKENQDFI